MRSLAVIPLFAALLIPRHVAGPTADVRACTKAGDVQAEYLQDLARRYHPEALTVENRNRYVIIGFILDTECRVQHHAVGTRHEGGLDVATTLAALFPGIRISPFVIAGIAEAQPPAAPGTPWVVWEVLRPSDH